MSQLPALPATCTAWRQGDVFDECLAFVTDHGGQAVPLPAPLGVVTLSQSCDAAQIGRLELQVAPVVQLEGDTFAEAAAGKRPRYAPLPAAGKDYFADLDYIATVKKHTLLASKRQRGVSGDAQIRRFAGSVARKFGRFAYPDDVVRCLGPMEKTLASKAAKPTSPLGKVLGGVYGFRVESHSDWSEPPFELVLVVLTEPGTLPTDPEDPEGLPPAPEGLRSRLSDPVTGRLSPRLNQIAEHLGRSELDTAERYWTWQYLAEAMAEQCSDRVNELGISHVVASVTHDLLSADEFPLTRVNQSESLDLDYLSEPSPRSRKP